MKKENRSVKLKMYFGAATACVLWLTVLYKRSSLLKKGLGELCFCLLMGAVILGYSVWNYRVLKRQGDPRWAENGQKVQSARMLRVINMFLLVFLPALEFVAFESLTTFLGTIGSIRYVAWNLFCIYLIVGILYVIFNRSGIAGLISNIALSVLGLTEYFVSKFRGQPLRMGDLLSWNTALEVSGQYKYNIKAEMLVGISIMLFLMVWCLWYSVRIRHIMKHCSEKL
ncbi:MAG: hypothetical protein Q4B57_10850, partial [Eubacteriales bacterium]|nr:hypothetical protein [Eubacteriales bacterium]